MFIKGLNQDLSFLVKRPGIEWETMSTPDLVNLTNQLSCTLDELPTRKTTKMINLQLQQMKTHKQNPKPPSFSYYCKQPGYWDQDCYKFKCFRHLQPSNQLFQCSPNFQWCGFKELQEHFQILPLNWLGKMLLQIGD